MNPNYCMIKFCDTVSHLHIKLQVVNFQRCRWIASGKEQEPLSLTSGVSEIAVCPPSPIAEDLQLYHLPPTLLLSVSNSSCLLTWCQPWYAGCCTAPLHFWRYWTTRWKMFSLSFVFVFMYYLCEKYKPIIV